MLALLASLAGCADAQRRAGPRTADGRIAVTSDSTFVADVIAPARPTAVYYWSNGCIPCLFMGPKLARVAPRYAGRVTFWKLEMGWSAERVRRYDVQVVPTLVLYVGDREIARQVGLPGGAAEDSFAVFLDHALALAGAPGGTP